MKDPGGMALFSKFFILTSIFFVRRLWVGGEWVQKGLQFDVLCEKIDL